MKAEQRRLAASARIVSIVETEPVGDDDIAVA